MSNSAYAIIQTGGKQHRVSAGDVIDVELLQGEEGSEVLFPALLVKGEEGIKVGRPTVEGFTIVGELMGKTVGDKLDCMTYKKRCNQRRRYGHRQHYSRVKIKDIKENH